MASSYPTHLADRPRSTAPVGVTLGYAAGNLGKSVVWTSFESLLLYYLVTFAGFSPLAAGGLLAGMMIWDGIADMVVGYFADRQGRPDVLGRLILIGAPLCGSTFCAIFALPANAGHLAVAAAVVACRIGYTLCDIGHNTLLVRVSASPREASLVSGLRLVFSAAGAGLVGLASSFALSAPRHAGQHNNFEPWAVGGGLLYVLTLMLAMRVTRALPAAVHATGRRPAVKLFAPLLHNRPYRRVLMLVILQTSLIALFGRALPFFGEVVHGNAAWAGPALATMTGTQGLSLPAWILLSRRLSSRVTLVVANSLMIVGLVLLHSDTGLWPATALIVIGAANAGMSTVIWALLSLSIRDAAVIGQRAEALPIGIFLAALKTASGAGGAILSLAVTLQRQTQGRHLETVVGWSPIILTATMLPLIGCACSLIIISLIPKQLA